MDNKGGTYRRFSAEKYDNENESYDKDLCIVFI